MRLPFGEYRPDVSDAYGEHSQRIENVFPRGDGYGPVRDLSVFTATLPDACRGSFVALDDDETVAIFAGTVSQLYKLNNSTLEWDEVSGEDYVLPTYDQWQFAQFGSHVLATQQNVALQVFTLGSSTTFADVSGSPPRARYISIVNEFVVLSGLVTTPYRIQWCARSDITGWTAGVDESDFQDFGDGGTVRGVAGGEFGVVFQDKAIRRLTYAPGSPLIFTIDRISEEEGLRTAGALIRSGEHVFFLSSSGFHRITSGGSPIPIGREKFDRTFFEEWDSSKPHLLVGANDPNSTRVMWCYRSLNSEADGDLFDRILVYDWLLERAAVITEISGQYICSAAEPGVTLEGLDELGLGLEDLPKSLDDYIAQFGIRVSVYGPDNSLGFLTGDNLEAVLETAESGDGARRAFVRGARPISDAPSVNIAVSSRQRLGATISWSGASPMNAVGVCPLRQDSRYYRFRATVPAGTDWTYIAGVEPDVMPSGMR